VTARDVLLEAMTEADLQRAIIRVAHLHGWLVHHDRPTTGRDGRTRTSIEGDAGFPDLVLARDGVVLIVECKSAHGRYEPGQRDWLDATGGMTIRPADLDRVLGRLMVGRKD
jgi:hypothetical protein